MTQALIAIALGSNLGDRVETLRRAWRELSKHLPPLRASQIYETSPAEVLDQPPFLNAVASFSSGDSPEDLLALCLRIEAQFGRQRLVPQGPRTLDLDLLFVGDLQRSTPPLTLPHPRMLRRAFVMIPLAEIHPELLHPQTHRPLGEMSFEDLDGPVQNNLGPLQTDQPGMP